MAGTSTSASGPSRRIGGLRIAIIEARFYEDIADEMAAGALAVIEADGSHAERFSVPGALELPQLAQIVAACGRTGTSARTARFDGIVALGCVIRGETSHYDIVCNNANHFLYEVARAFTIPIGNAILTVDTREQALARARGGIAGKGGDAARACLRLIEIAHDLHGRPQ
ncbi:MAG TPA: 6,7-dimethyl-8-ribityllumazine synthase [Hyphomicrobiaceae bacterium]|nr:6,7-dimethyl-8-ribityllumazine synthase [Hyphomicrobiaceae bacterium]